MTEKIVEKQYYTQVQTKATYPIKQSSISTYKVIHFRNKFGILVSQN